MQPSLSWIPPRHIIVTYQLSCLQTWGTAYISHGSSPRLNLNKAPLCWSCQSQTKSKLFHLEGWIQQIDSDINPFSDWCMPCAECHIGNTCEILPMMGHFWEEQHMLAQVSQEWNGYPCTSQESSAQSSVSLQFTRSEHMYGFTYVLEGRNHPMCWFRVPFSFVFLLTQLPPCNSLSCMAVLDWLPRLPPGDPGDGSAVG
jgi:hypothetical protein